MRTQAQPREHSGGSEICRVHVVLAQLRIRSEAYSGDGKWSGNFVVNGDEQNVDFTLEPGETRGGVAFFNLDVPDACGEDVTVDFAGAVTGRYGTDRLRGRTGEFEATRSYPCPSRRQATFKTRVAASSSQNGDVFADLTFRFHIRLFCPRRWL